jgi:hypothetical protein
VLNPHQPLPLDAQAASCSIARCDWTTTRSTSASASPQARAFFSAGADVVRGQHRRRPEAPQPVDVVARDPEPLHVGDVRVQRADAADQARALGGYSSPFAGSRRRERGARRTSRDETGRKSSSRT